MNMHPRHGHLTRVACFGLLIVCSLGAISCGAPPASIDIVVIPALKGEIFPSEEDSQGIRSGGISLISAQLNEVRSAAGTTIVVAANGTIPGSPEAFFSQGDDVIGALNRVGVDALFLDARDFGFGKSRLEDLSRRAEFPFIAANIRYTDGSSPDWIQPFYYDARTGLALIGLAGPNLILRNLDEHVEGLMLIDEKKAVEEALAGLAAFKPSRIGVIAIGHKTTRNMTTVLWKVTDSGKIDFVVQGDLEGDLAGLHTKVRNADTGRSLDAVLVGIADEPADKARHLSRIAISPGGIAGKPEIDYSLLSVDSRAVIPDDSLRDFLYHIRTVIDSLLADRITEASDQIGHTDQAESPLGNLVTDLMREYSGADIALLNGGSLRNGYSAGAVTMGDVYRSMPFGGNLVTGRISGSMLLAALNRSVGFIGRLDRGRGLLQVSGIRFVYHPEWEDGHQVDAADVFVGEKPLVLSGSYLICTDRFLTTGGDGYTEFRNISDAKTETQSIVTIVSRLLASRPRWSARVEGRFGPIQIAISDTAPVKAGQ